MSYNTARDARRVVTGRLLLESDSTQARTLEGRPLAMHSSLVLSERSRLSLSNSRLRSATTSPLSSLAHEQEGRLRLVTREPEKWKNDRL